MGRNQSIVTFSIGQIGCYVEPKAAYILPHINPRPAMEAIGMILIAGLAYALSRQTGEVGNALPVLGALALVPNAYFRPCRPFTTPGYP